MLPFRPSDRVVALDDADIVESHELKPQDVELELDLGDAVEVHLARASSTLSEKALPAPRTPPARRPSGTIPVAMPVPGFLQPQTRVYQFGQLDQLEAQDRPLTLKTPSQALKPAVISSHLPETVARPPHSAQMRAAARNDVARDDDDEEEELTELKPPSRSSWNPRRAAELARSPSHITPSPFARSFVMQDPTQERPESIAPVAVSTHPSVPPHDPSAGRTSTTMRLRVPSRLRGGALDEAERAESAIERAESAELTAITSTPSTKILRGVALMLMGGVAAAAITAYALRNDVPTASVGVAPPPPMASIVVPQDAVLIGATPPPQMETRPGAQPVAAAAATQAAGTEPVPSPVIPTVVKFGDADTLLVAPAPAVAPSALAANASGAANATANANANASAPRKPRKTTSVHPSQPLPPNALLPDSDSPPSYSLPPSRGGAPKDPVAEAQLRASMR